MAAEPGTRPGPAVRARQRAFVPMVGPALALLGVFVLGPACHAVWISLQQTAGYGDSRFVGLRNYARLLGDPVFHTALLNTLKLLVVGGGVTFAAGFALTMVLREMRGRLVARNILFFPNIVSALVPAIVAGFLFNPDGLVNTVLRGVFGVSDPPKWLAVDNTFTLILIVAIWAAVGYYTTIIMAAVDRIPASFYEDCALLGATSWQRLRHVTIPLTWDVLSVCALLWTISSIKVFELVLVFGGGTAGTPPSSTWTVALYSYAATYGGSGSPPELGMTAASALFSLLIAAAVVLLLRRALDREAVRF
ncbi:sugar ABC transporter permease [Nonomuraea sp. NPDC049637]|uniref:carbohydrate ABC transporter permease n=1 Tax=Nonomuraea sp. NPDC049637 TaxID=3154356 RepID=UPI003423561C